MLFLQGGDFDQNLPWFSMNTENLILVLYKYRKSSFGPLNNKSAIVLVWLIQTISVLKSFPSWLSVFSKIFLWKYILRIYNIYNIYYIYFTQMDNICANVNALRNFFRGKVFPNFLCEQRLGKQVCQICWGMMFVQGRGGQNQSGHQICSGTRT